MRCIWMVSIIIFLTPQQGRSQQIPIVFPLSGNAFCSPTACFSPDRTISVSSIIAPAIEANQRVVRESAALAGAITILPPNQGDRFALTFGGADSDGYGALSVNGTARITGSALAFGGYARSGSQNLAKGGVSFSFR
jgi:hypothetical protein